MPDLTLPTLCLVTDRQRSGGRPLEEVVSLALDGGVNMVQLREKDLPAGRLLEIARRLRTLTRGRALLFVNDRADVALASEADGVQLGEESIPAEAARRIAGARLLVGRSVHTVDGAVEAGGAGADLLVVGSIFPSESHPEAAAAGVGLLEQLRPRVKTPYLAIGGVNVRNAGSAIGSGADGVAVITAITQSDDPTRASRELAASIRRAWASAGREKAGRAT